LTANLQALDNQNETVSSFSHRIGLLVSRSAKPSLGRRNSEEVVPAPTTAVADRDYSVRAVDRVCAILNLVQERIEGISLGDVAQATQLPKSSAFRYLWTLENHRYVERDDVTGLYKLGLTFAGMQSRHLELLRHRAHPLLENLRDDFGETVNLGVLDGDAVVYLDIVESRRAVRLAAKRGDRDPVNSTALGKAITAGLSESTIRMILNASGMQARTEKSIVTPEDFLAELVRVRRLGYAVDDGENEIDGRCVAVAIPEVGVPAGLSLSAPSARFPLRQVSQVAGALKEAAASLVIHAGSADKPPSTTEID
jgi:IclR family acetate operon transcriptional repressor